MPARRQPIDDLGLPGLTERGLRRLVQEHDARVVPRLDRLWSYYRNAVALPGTGRGDHASAQEIGLPDRLRRRPGPPGGRPEPVVENDIAWRIDALVDFVFGRPPRIESTAADERVRTRIEEVLGAVWEASGGIVLLQDMALLGAVHGHVDLLLRVDHRAPYGLRVEIVSATRGIPILDPGDYRRMHGYLIRAHTPPPPGDLGARPSEVLEILAPGRREVRVDGEVVERSPVRLAALPVVHVQNASQPYAYSGLSDVEPLVPLQDELNTRLSDRAHRVTMQSFRMYLARGVDGFADVPVGPGQVWSTDNPEASIESFGGDASAPSEREHVEQIREAMDKLSSVSPIVLGLLRAKVGHLSSENALRITLMGVLSRTARKRVTYGRGIVEMSRLVLDALHRRGTLRTSERDRGLRIDWPDPLPLDEHQRVRTASAKLDLGVPREQVLEELGYAGADVGIQ